MAMIKITRRELELAQSMKGDFQLCDINETDERFVEALKLGLIDDWGQPTYYANDLAYGRLDVEIED